MAHRTELSPDGRSEEGTRGEHLPDCLALLTPEETAALEPYLEEVQFPAGACIFRVDDPGDGCYIIDSGTVRVDLDRSEFRTQSEIDSDTTLGYVDAGELLGELSLLDRLPRSASAYAQTDISGRHISTERIDRLARSQPAVAMALYAALGRGAALKLRGTNERLAQAIFPDAPEPLVGEMVARAVAAQREIEDWPEDRIDALLATMAQGVADRAEQLAQASVAETGLGNVQSKIVKDRICSLGAYAQLVGAPGAGPLQTDAEQAVTELASPMGVIFALGPVTNPVSTFIFKALACVKSRNALIYSPNHRALGVTASVQAIIDEALATHGAPADLVQSIRTRASRKLTGQFMAHPDVSFILATGGPSVVNAAYSSGTPAIGVGAGNTPVLISSTADLPSVVSGIAVSKPFDNGMLCGSEHNLVVTASVRSAFIEECERQSVTVLSPEEAVRFTRRIVDPTTGRFHPQVIGQPAAALAHHAGIRRDYPIQLIIVPTEDVSPGNPYTHEKLTPVLSLFTAETDDTGLEICLHLLAIEGRGHNAVIHSQDEDLIKRFGDRMPASRILVNTPASQGMLGITTGLQISPTLGCGTFGRTSTTDNVTFRHLRNVKRIARFLPSALERWQGLI